MIARVWTAHATAANAIQYRDHLRTQVIPALRRLAGYESTTLLTKASGEDVEILVITRWTSMNAIRAFAGDDVERAVVAEEAALLLQSWDERVRHYDVPVEDQRESNAT